MKIFDKNRILSAWMIAFVFGLAFLFQACDDNPDEYEIDSGTPTVDFIRITDSASTDSLVTHAFMNNTIALMGENLKSINELWFNDQKAYLNSSFITSTSLIVTIPNVIPGVVTNKMYMIVGADTLAYDFKVDVPAPRVSGMKCEYVADGDIAVIKGNYFIDDPNIPLSVTFPGNILATEIVSIDIEEIQVRVPEGVGEGEIAVKSLYGNSRSSFFFRDTRNIILDWDVLDAAGGWRSGNIASSDPEGISGNYVRFEGSMAGENGATWDEDSFSFNLWNNDNGRPDVPFYDGDLASAVIKFECYVIEAWKASALQMIFTPYTTSGTNGYISDTALPRGLWLPWTGTGSYQTEGWVTVTVPLSEFIYTHEGKTSGSSFDNSMMGGLTFFIFNGGVDGEDCDIHMCIDNIRVVPQ